MHWDVKQSGWHHVETLDELCEPGAEVHFSLELQKHVSMVVIGMREQSIDSPDNRDQELDGRRLHGDPAAEVLGTVQDGTRMVESVHHVVNSAAFLRVFVRGAEVNKVVGCFHLGTTLGSAGGLQLDYQEV